MIWLKIKTDNMAGIGNYKGKKKSNKSGGGPRKKKTTKKTTKKSY